MPEKQTTATDTLPPWPLDERPGFLARRLQQIHTAMFMEICGAFEITPVQYSLMSALGVRGAADQTTLAADIALDRTTTTGALKRLEKRDLVERPRSAADRRARHCVLTAKGSELLARMEPFARKAHMATVASLSAAEQATFIRLLQRIVEANSHRTAPPPPMV